MSVALQAVYKSHRTTADGGFTISFDVSDKMADQLNEIFRKRNERLFIVVMSEDDYLDSQAEGKDG